ncbi:hypothetical protein F5Y00DRAFT_269380 [Daldinia vernicosa]|uniref:uncharacterized protein n=1 Tax=Daldinia vernicosa TaxID=114800 RepID=UPI002008390C|nr:uncharacterized protein F5Y00DRAFT_269380 [Daldinia vernicosa]KAI0849399.1 hypothetical protein F5Y00DRAFT_269380 [Daldinia vernicosa]
MSQISMTPEEILNGPALQPPPGHKPNFEHPANLNAVAQFTNAICLCSITLVTLIRAYAKVSNRNKLEIEDGALSTCFSTYIREPDGSLWCSYYVLHMIGAFPHQWDVRLRDLAPIFYIHHLGFNFCAATSGLWKAAILLEWNRIFVPRGTRNSFYWIGNILLAFNSITTIAYITAENMSCFPYRKIWDKTILEGYCINQKIFQIPGCFMNTIYIAAVMVLTQRTIWRLQVATKKKMGVSFLFLVGLLALASSIARAVAMIKFLDSDDKTYTINGVYLWTLAENTCCFLALCAPWIPRAFSNTDSIRRIIDKIVFYTRISRRNSRRTSKSHTWPSQQVHVERELWDADRMYHGMRDATMPLVKYPSLSSRNEQSDLALPSDGILMTTEIVVAIDTVDRRSSSRDYPWSNA